MSRTGIDASTFAQDLRERAGDGSIDWVNQPIQASALLDMADMLEENAKLLELCRDMLKTIQVMDGEWHSLTDFTTMAEAAETYDFNAENAPEYEEKLRELGIEAKE